MAATRITIGGASGYWGDAALATPQLLAARPDVIVYDYLAEITMGILARAHARDADAGYATDFVTSAMAPHLSRIAEQGTRVIANAGGVNPRGCAAALRDAIAAAGLDLSVACVTGDDLMPALSDLAAAAPRDMFNGRAIPAHERIASANAYLGAFPIARALDRGADIVITGRCVDSAVTLGACIHAFGWQASDLDQLAGGSLAGHILECGTQATGGNFTDWASLSTGLASCGYPLAVIDASGSFEITKPSGTGGAVTRATVAEQMLYEIGDPASYVLPDVICDFTSVEIGETGPDRVRVTGARGRGVPSDYKVCVTFSDGFRGGHYFTFYGRDAEAAATCFAEAALARARRALSASGLVDFSEVSTELLGAESQWGQARRQGPSREVVLKLAARHVDARGIEVLLREATGMALAGPPGLSGFAGSRPRPSPVMALWSGLIPKSAVCAKISDASGAEDHVADAELVAPIAPGDMSPLAEPDKPDGPFEPVALHRLAYARSGDKGDAANIGVIARDPAFLPALWHGLDRDVLQQVFGHFWSGACERYLLPGTHALNIVLHEALGGGGVSSLRNDPQGKGFAQLLLATSVPLPLRLMPLLDSAAEDARPLSGQDQFDAAPLPSSDTRQTP